ncbi:hypothetical protein Y032_0119g834 [Ancylostoma ceylanicum]|uniref:Reverse transcriptase domain-containing protein n=1 Tax=Ancylostoma ceylanicum TaxID=53326 RepID=A0A016TB73_9BILA|nr:hypothetical protein Y032_0119g834 [Ancylostoma ceylanicum]
MGQRLAPVLAICFMSKIEEPVLSRCPLMYCRYIDDCCIVTSTQSEMDECFGILNQHSQSQYISFTTEKPCDEWLPYLNTQLMLANGTLHVKWYRKESSKNIILPARSAHPTVVKRAIVRGVFKTALEVSNGESERQESLRMANETMSGNGYSSRPERARKTVAANAGNRDERELPLCLPFFSDRVSAAVKQCLTQAHLQDVALVNIPNENIRRQLVRNRLYDKACVLRNCVVCSYGRIGDCTKSGVVYLPINCTKSGVVRM